MSGETLFNLLKEIKDLLNEVEQATTDDHDLKNYLHNISTYINAYILEATRDPSIINFDGLTNSIAVYEARQLKKALEALKSPLAMLSILIDKGGEAITPVEYAEKHAAPFLKTFLQTLQDTDRHRIDATISGNINQISHELNEIKNTYIPEKIFDAIKASNNDNIVQLEIIEKNREEIIDNQVCAHQKSAKRWIGTAFIAASITLALGVVLYFNHTSSPSLFVQTREIFINIFLMGFLTTLTFLSFRQYAINKHNQLQWLHKKYATSTFLRLARESALDAETRKSIIIKTLDAVFHLPEFGYLKSDSSTYNAELLKLAKNLTPKNE